MRLDSPQNTALKNDTEKATIPQEVKATLETWAPYAQGGSLPYPSLHLGPRSWRHPRPQGAGEQLFSSNFRALNRALVPTSANQGSRGQRGKAALRSPEFPTSSSLASTTRRVRPKVGDQCLLPPLGKRRHKFGNSYCFMTVTSTRLQNRGQRRL